MKISREELSEISRNVKIGNIGSVANAIASAYQLGRNDGVSETKEVIIKIVVNHSEILKKELDFANIIAKSLKNVKL
jgi:hypothetical protein